MSEIKRGTDMFDGAAGTLAIVGLAKGEDLLVCLSMRLPPSPPGTST